MRLRRPSRRAAVVLSASAGLLLAGYVGTAAWAGSHVPRGTEVAGVRLGGLGAEQARDRLATAGARAADRPVELRLGERRATLQPAAAGLRLDVDGTVASLTGFSLAPGRVLDAVFGGEQEDAVLAVDRGALVAALEKAAQRVDVPATEGAVTFAGGTPGVTRPRPGTVVDLPKAVDTLLATWPTDGPVELPSRTTAPAVSGEALDEARREFAEPALSGPLRLVVGGRTLTLTPAQIAPTLEVVPDGRGGLRPRLDSARLAAVVERLAPDLQRPAVDAKVVLRGGRPVVVPAVPGTRLDPASLPEAVLPALTSPQRQARVALAVQQPKVTTAAARALGITEKVSTFTTRFPDNPPRTANIKLAAATIDGTVVRPGEVFSLNAALGQRTRAKGYNEAPVIMDGRLTQDFGGGVSQVSTAVFNAVFFAGLDVITHKPHSFYISRYPEGREATLSWPTVDNRWRNDSGRGILIDTSISGRELTVTFWGTKVWDVEAVKSARRNVVPPKKIYDDDGDCVRQSPSPGFDVTVTRVMRKAGGQTRREAFRTHYIPEDEVICGPRPQPKPSPSPSAPPASPAPARTTAPPAR